MSKKIGPVHWNSHLLCAVDIETSGRDPLKHDILQLCVLPLAPDLTPATKILPFYVELQPQKSFFDVEPEAMRTNKLDWQTLYETALDPWKVAELFEEWWEKLGLPFRKSIIPLAHNYPFEYKFLEAWLGPEAMNHYFYQFRDTMALANAINDMADFNNEPYPFPKTSLGYIATQLKIENPNPHDALGDCITTAAVYRRMVREFKITF